MLARMVGVDENALVCDFAETYHILNWRGLPARLAATLAVGLRPSARIMLKLSGNPAPLEDMLLATIADACRLRVWLSTEAGLKGEHKPPSLFSALFEKTEAKSKPSGFASGEDFHKWRKSMLRGAANG